MDNIYRYYTLSYSEKDSHSSYRRTGRLGVIAKDVVEAIRLGQRLKPESTVWNVSHHGVIDGIAANAKALVVEE
jgi:hypothetical protein